MYWREEGAQSVFSKTQEKWTVYANSLFSFTPMTNFPLVSDFFFIDQTTRHSSFLSWMTSDLISASTTVLLPCCMPLAVFFLFLGMIVIAAHLFVAGYVFRARDLIWRVRLRTIQGGLQSHKWSANLRLVREKMDDSIYCDRLPLNVLMWTIVYFITSAYAMEQEHGLSTAVSKIIKIMYILKTARQTTLFYFSLRSIIIIGTSNHYQSYKRALMATIHCLV